MRNDITDITTQAPCSDSDFSSVIDFICAPQHIPPCENSVPKNSPTVTVSLLPVCARKLANVTAVFKKVTNQNG